MACVTVFQFKMAEKNTARMEDEHRKVEARVNVLLQSWTDLCDLVEAKDFLLKSRVLFKETCLLLLGPNWTRVSTIAKSKLTLILHQSLQAATSQCARSKDLVETLMDLLLDPWGNAALKEVLNTDHNGPEQIALYDYYCKTEKAEVSWLRLLTLEENQCEDLALKLCTCCLQCSIFSNEPQLVDMNTRLLFHEGLFDQLNQEMSRYSCHEGLEMIQRILAMNRKDSVPIAIYLSNLFLVKDMVLPSEYCCTKQLMVTWINLQLRQNDDLSLLRKEILKICSLATTSAHFYLMVDLLNQRFGDDMLRLYVELYVRGLTVDINYLENVRLTDSPEGVLEIEKHVANMLERLAVIIGKYKRLARECILTAFSIDPCEERLTSMEKYVDVPKAPYHSVNGVPIVPCSGQCHCEKKGECRRLLKEAGIVLNDATVAVEDDVEMDASSPLPEVSVDELNEICSTTDGEQRDVGSDLEGVDNQFCLEADNLLKSAFFRNKEAKKVTPTPSKELSSESSANNLPSYMLFTDSPAIENNSSISQWNDAMFQLPPDPKPAANASHGDECMDVVEGSDACKEEDSIYFVHSPVLDMDIDIEKETLSDLSIVLDEPRHKILTWELGWNELKHRCDLYMRMRCAMRTMLQAISLSQQNHEKLDGVKDEANVELVEAKVVGDESKRKSKARKEKQKELATLVNLRTRDFNIASMKFLNPKVVISHSDMVDANRQLQGKKNAASCNLSAKAESAKVFSDKSPSSHGSVLREALTSSTSSILRAYRPKFAADGTKRLIQMGTMPKTTRAEDNPTCPIGLPQVALVNLNKATTVVVGNVAIKVENTTDSIMPTTTSNVPTKLPPQKVAANNDEIALLCQKDYQNACEQLSQHILLHTTNSDVKQEDRKEESKQTGREQNVVMETTPEILMQTESVQVPNEGPRPMETSTANFLHKFMPAVVQKVQIKTDNFPPLPLSSSSPLSENGLENILKPELFPNPLTAVSRGQGAEMHVSQSLQRTVVSIPTLSQLTSAFQNNDLVENGSSLATGSGIIQPTNEHSEATSRLIEQILTEGLQGNIAKSQPTLVPYVPSIVHCQTNGTCLQAGVGPPNGNCNIAQINGNMQTEVLKVNSISLPTNLVLQNVELQVDNSVEVSQRTGEVGRPAAPQTYVIKMIDLSNALAVEGKQLTLIKTQPEVQTDMDKMEIQQNGFEDATTLAMDANSAQFQENVDAIGGYKQVVMKGATNQSVVHPVTLVPPRVASAPPASRAASPLLQLLVDHVSKVYDGNETVVLSGSKQKLLSKKNDKKWVSVRNQHGGMEYRKVGQASPSVPKSKYNFCRPTTTTVISSPQVVQGAVLTTTSPTFARSRNTVTYAQSNFVTQNIFQQVVAESDVKIAVPAPAAMPDPVFIKELPRIVDVNTHRKASMVVPVVIQNSKEVSSQTWTEKLQQCFGSTVKVNGVVAKPDVPSPEFQPQPTFVITNPTVTATEPKTQPADTGTPESIRMPLSETSPSQTNLPLSTPSHPVDVKEQLSNSSQMVMGPTTSNDFAPGVCNAGMNMNVGSNVNVDQVRSDGFAEDGAKNPNQNVTRAPLPAEPPKNVQSNQKASKPRPKKKKQVTSDCPLPSNDEFARHVSELIQSVKRSQELMEEKEAKSKKKKAESDKTQKASAKKESKSRDDKSNSSPNKPACPICANKFCSTFSLRRHLQKVHKLDNATIQAEKLSKSTVTTTTTTTAPSEVVLPPAPSSYEVTNVVVEKFAPEERVEPTLYRPSKNERDVLMCQTEEMPKLLFETNSANDCQLDGYEHNQENFEATSAAFNLFTDPDQENYLDKLEYDKSGYGGFNLFSDPEVETGYPLGSGLDDDESDLMSRIDNENMKISRNFDMSLAENFDMAASALKACGADPDLGKMCEPDLGKPCDAADLVKACSVDATELLKVTCNVDSTKQDVKGDLSEPCNTTTSEINVDEVAAASKPLEPTQGADWSKDREDTTSTEGSIDSTSFIKGRTRGRAKGSKKRNCPCCESSSNSLGSKKCRTDSRGSKNKSRDAKASGQDSRSRNTIKR